MAASQEPGSTPSFQGFVPADFHVFALPGFDARMQELRGYLRPRLLAMAESVRPALESTLGRPLFPHVAAHLRRRVNPPSETWAAFGPSPRGYKSFAHFAIGIHADGLFFRLVLKDEALQDRRFLGGLLRDEPQSYLDPLPDDLTIHQEPLASDIEIQSVAAVRDHGSVFVPGLLRSRDTQWSVGLDVPREDPRLLTLEGVTGLAANTLRGVLPVWEVLPSWWNHTLWSPGRDGSQ